MPVVSVIIPNYNHAGYLNQRIESVLAQTFQDFELIILDDCSTDNSQEIIEQYRHHPKLQSIVYNTANSGSTFRQWAKGIELCRGAYVWIAESDDWCEPAFLETVLNGMMKADPCVIGYCQSYCIEKENVIRWQSAHSRLNEVIDGQDFITQKMLTSTAVFNASMAVWKREVYSLVTNEYTNYRYCGDWLFWIELSRHGSVYISGKLLNYFRKHDQDVTSKATLRGGQIIEIINMFNLIYKRGWIDQKRYLAALKSIYIHYKAISKSLDESMRQKINAVFFYDASVKAFLRRAHLAVYSRYAVKKLFRLN
jgi:glycosyltransferase involved in cell wall biosynthesis